MGNQYSWSDKKILIVEDEENNARLLQLLLKDTGAQLHHVYTGNDTMSFVHSNPDTDLILMDINIPEKDGLMCTAEIKELYPSIKIIAQSAYVGVIKQSHIERVGADDFVPKPIDHQELLQKMDRLLK